MYEASCSSSTITSPRSRIGAKIADRAPTTTLRLAAGDAIALVAALGLPERGVEHRDRGAEPLAEAADGLRRERDLRHEHDRAEPSRECRLACLEIHLGLAAPGRSDEQQVRSRRLVEAGDDARDRGALLVGQRGGGCLTGERLALGRRGPLPARRPAKRSNELECAGRCRAVVVGDPQCEVDEGRRDLVEHLPDGRDLDTHGRLDSDLDDHTARRAAAESHLDDRSLARPRPVPRR